MLWAASHFVKTRGLNTIVNLFSQLNLDPTQCPAWNPLVSTALHRRWNSRAHRLPRLKRARDALAPGETTPAVSGKPGDASFARPGEEDKRQSAKGRSKRKTLRKLPHGLWFLPCPPIILFSFLLLPFYFPVCLCRRWSPTRSALAMMVSDGLTAVLDTKKLPSPTYRLSKSCALRVRVTGQGQVLQYNIAKANGGKEKGRESV